MESNLQSVSWLILFSFVKSAVHSNVDTRSGKPWNTNLAELNLIDSHCFLKSWSFAHKRWNTLLASSPLPIFSVIMPTNSHFSPELKGTSSFLYLNIYYALWESACILPFSLSKTSDFMGTCQCFKLKTYIFLTLSHSYLSVPFWLCPMRQKPNTSVKRWCAFWNKFNYLLKSFWNNFNLVEEKVPFNSLYCWPKTLK